MRRRPTTGHRHAGQSVDPGSRYVDAGTLRVAQRAQAELQARERLPKLIVQLARHSSPLILARRLEESESARIFAREATSSASAALRSDVARNAHGADDLPMWISDR